MCNRISVPLQSSPCKIHVIFQSGAYKSLAGPDQKHMELPAQICQTPRDRHAACNAEGGQKGLLPKVLCRPQIAGDHRIHAVVKRAAGDEGNGRCDEKRRGRRIAAPGKDLALELGDFIGLDICLAIMDVLYKETGDSKYRACPLIRKMVRGGNLGCKSGKGFYVYNADRTKTPVDQL